MRYVIYGVNRVAKDFLYIFDDLEIMGFIEEGSKREHFLGYDVYTLEEALSQIGYDQIILCGFDHKSGQRELELAGLKYGDDFVYEEDFFDRIDDITVPRDKKIAIWGTGTVAEEFRQFSDGMEIDCYIDTYKKEEFFNGVKVQSPEDIKDWKDWFIIVAVARDAQIRGYLRKKELQENIDYVNFQKIIGMPSRLLKKTIFDEGYYNLECNTMLNHLEVFYEGNTRCCCTTFVSENLDNIFEKEPYDLWHSFLHKVMCLSIVNRTYSFCNKTMCPLFVANKASAFPASDLERPYKAMTERPEVLALSYDSSCNLCCKTCREEVRFAQGEEKKRIDEITERIKRDYLSYAEFLILAGDGEVFASEAYGEIYKDKRCNPKYIRLLSNGTLFSPNRWQEMIEGKTGKIMMTVSIDAATEETYSKIRRNGNFNTLKSNMDFAAELRRTGKLRYLRFNFVVQKENYREMIPFVQWGERLGVDEVFFTKILNWGTYSKSEFKEISMMEADGVTPKEELVAVLKDPVMAESKIVDLGTIQYMHKPDNTEVVDNYYKWELEKRGGKIFE